MYCSRQENEFPNSSEWTDAALYAALLQEYYISIFDIYGNSPIMVQMWYGMVSSHMVLSNNTLQELQNFVPFSKDVGHLFHVNIH